MYLIQEILNENTFLIYMSERIKTQTFDYIIIGGGISGFYTVHKILENMVIKLYYLMKDHISVGDY